MAETFRHPFLILFLIFFHSTQSFAQWDSDSVFDFHARKGVDYTYNLEFEKAQSEFNELTRLKLDHPAGYFFLAMMQWWKILINLENESYDNEFYSMLDKVIDLCDKRLDKNENDITALFFKGGALGFRGRLRANRSQWFGAALAGRKALPIIQKIHELDPNNYDVLLGTGIYNYYAEIIPETYPILKPLMWFVPKGDKAKGIVELRLASEKAKYANIEAAYFLMQLSYYFEKNYTAVFQLATRLHSQYPNNSLFHRYLGRAYVSLNRWDEANITFTEILQRCEKNQVGYTKPVSREAYYYIGAYEMSVGKLDDAFGHFSLCDQLSRELDKGNLSGFGVMANLRTGMIYDLMKKRDYAVQAYKKVLSMDEYEDSHKQARQFLDKPYGQH